MMSSPSDLSIIEAIQDELTEVCNPNGEGNSSIVQSLNMNESFDDDRVLLQSDSMDDNHLSCSTMPKSAYVATNSSNMSTVPVDDKQKDNIRPNCNELVEQVVDTLHYHNDETPSPVTNKGSPKVSMKRPTVSGESIKYTLAVAEISKKDSRIKDLESKLERLSTSYNSLQVSHSKSAERLKVFEDSVESLKELLSINKISFGKTSDISPDLFDSLRGTLDVIQRNVVRDEIRENLLQESKEEGRNGEQSKSSPSFGVGILSPLGIKKRVFANSRLSSKKSNGPIDLRYKKPEQKKSNEDNFLLRSPITPLRSKSASVTIRSSSLSVKRPSSRGKDGPVGYSPLVSALGESVSPSSSPYNHAISSLAYMPLNSIPASLDASFVTDVSYSESVRTPNSVNLNLSFIEPASLENAVNTNRFISSIRPNTPSIAPSSARSTYRGRLSTPIKISVNNTSTLSSILPTEHSHSNSVNVLPTSTLSSHSPHFNPHFRSKLTGSVRFPRRLAARAFLSQAILVRGLAHASSIDRRATLRAALYSLRLHALEMQNSELRAALGPRYEEESAEKSEPNFAESNLNPESSWKAAPSASELRTLRAAAAESQQLSASLASTRARLVSLEQEADRLRAQNITLAAGGEAAVARLQEDRARLQAAGEALAAAETELLQTRRSRDVLATEFRRIADIAERVPALQERLTELEELLQRAKQALKSRETEAAHLRQKEIQFDEINSLFHIFANFSSQPASSSTNEDDSSISARNDIGIDLESGSLSERVERLFLTSRGRSDALRHLEHALSLTNRALQAAQSRATALERELQQKESERKQSENSADSVAAAAREMRDLRAELQETRARMQELQTERDRAIDSARESSLEKDSLSARLSVLERRCAVLEGIKTRYDKLMNDRIDSFAAK